LRSSQLIDSATLRDLRSFQLMPCTAPTAPESPVIYPFAPVLFRRPCGQATGSPSLQPLTRCNGGETDPGGFADPPHRATVPA
jgi:hypothetical protein